jgi:solute carrier family 5 (sodium-coupled monocarboxylate transporter), member 8/12
MVSQTLQFKSFIKLLQHLTTPHSFNPDPTVRHSWVSILIGSSFTYLTLYAVNQAQVQRLLTVKDLKSAQLAVWISWPILSFLSLSTAFSGLVIYYYYRNCDPVAQGRIDSRDQNMPRYVIDGEVNKI